MKKIQFLAVGALALLLASCGSSKSYTYTSRTISIADGVELLPTQTYVDVNPDFSKRIMAESSVCSSTEEAMDEAKYNAIVNNKVDIVVDPIYKIEESSNGYKAYLTGFAGYYVNPRTVLGDIKAMEDVSKEAVEKYLMIHDAKQIVPYMYQQSDHICINHGGHCGKAPSAPAQQVTTAPTTTTTTRTSSSSSRRK
ncbi:MAG: hypothetical protein MJZ79_01035 [Paludibacteraceae bacterium]|nr:hypothetical protein [Paludibacteraceae bacterium]